MDYDIKDLKLANEGKLRIDWAEVSMPVLRLIKRRFQRERPLKGLRVTACLHVTTETANLMKTLRDEGRRCPPVRVKPSQYPGRCSSFAGCPRRNPRVCHQRRGQQNLLPTYSIGNRAQAANHHG